MSLDRAGQAIQFSPCEGEVRPVSTSNPPQSIQPTPLALPDRPITHAEIVAVETWLVAVATRGFYNNTCDQDMISFMISANMAIKKEDTLVIYCLSFHTSYAFERWQACRFRHD